MSQSNAVGRLQFELTRDKLDEIERLRIDGGFDTRKDLLNNAMTLMKWALKHAEEGHAIAAIDGGKYFELQMPFLTHAAEKRAKAR